MRGFGAGVHLALPSAPVVVVISLDGAIEMAAANGSEFRSYMSPVAALHRNPRTISHHGRAFDITIEMTPAGARALLGIPCRLLSDRVVELTDLWGTTADELIDRLLIAPDWPRRFASLDSMLIEIAGKIPANLDPLFHAWGRLSSASDRVSVADAAREVGYSRRHLRDRFVAEYGVTPSRVARLGRFQRSVKLLRDRERRRRNVPSAPDTTLAEVAVEAGFYDHAHMTRDWNDIAGYSPSAWLAAEELPFVQDTTGASHQEWGT